MAGFVQIRSRRPGFKAFEYLKYDLEKLNTTPGGPFAGKIRDVITDLLFDGAIEVTKPRLKKMGRAMAVAGNQELALLGRTIRNLIGIPGQHHAAIRFDNQTNPVGGNFDNNLDLNIVPSTAGGTSLKRAKAQANTLIWNKLSQAYWEAKGKKGFFLRSGALLQEIAATDFMQRLGPIHVVFIPENFVSDTKKKTIDKKELLGFFRLTYLKSAFFRPSIIPALNPGTSITTVDPKFQLEKLLFGTLTATRLGADAGNAAKGSGKFTPRHLVQPALAWFLTERIPAAMARVVPGYIRG